MISFLKVLNPLLVSSFSIRFIGYRVHCRSGGTITLSSIYEFHKCKHNSSTPTSLFIVIARGTRILLVAFDVVVMCFVAQELVNFSHFYPQFLSFLNFLLCTLFVYYINKNFHQHKSITSYLFPFMLFWLVCLVVAIIIYSFKVFFNTLPPTYRINRAMAKNGNLLIPLNL